MNRLGASIHGPNHKWWALATVAIGTYMSTLDSSIVNVALPTILRDLHSDLATIEWVVAAYLLTLTALLLSVGRLADLWGRKRVYTLGFGIFTLSSLGCGLALAPSHLILSRVVQAIGAAMLQANGLAITGAVFPREERGRALGMNGTVVSIGLTSGSAIGGLLVGAFGWRSIFLVNLPIGVLGIAMALLVLDEKRISFGARGGAEEGRDDGAVRRQRFDPAGALVVTVTLVALLFALNQGPERGWTSPLILSLLAVAAIGFACFLAIERRVAAPLIDLALFRIRAFSAGALAAWLSFLAISANVFLLPFYLQLVLGYGPARAGLLLTPTALTQALIAPFSGWLSDRFGARVLSSIGLSVSASALLLIGTLPASAHYGDVVPRLVLLGLGNGLFNSPNTSSILGAIPRRHYGVAAGFVSMVRNSGQVTGVALAGALLLSAVVPIVGHGGLGALRTTVDEATRGPLVAAFMHGYRQAYFVAAGLAACGLAASLSRGRRRESAEQTEPATASGKRAREAAD